MFHSGEMVCSLRHECCSNSQLSLNFVRTEENCRKLYQLAQTVHFRDSLPLAGALHQTLAGQDGLDSDHACMIV
jgi:hypothetical protein